MMTLNDEQRKAVETESNNVLVIAGAGSGKTRVLTERVRHLLNKGIPASSMVIITFTNMAAEEMKERLSDISVIGDAFVGTLHSFANRLMKASGEKYKIFDEQHENDFARYCIRRFCKYLTWQKFIEYKELKYRIEMGEYSESLLTDYFTPAERDEYNLLYAKKPKGYFLDTISTCAEKSGVITFDELLKRATAYFKSLDTSLDYVMVDEFQDIGYLEYQFIKGLKSKNYFFVGDDWQAIYGFKGGDVNIFLNLSVNKDWKKYYLTNNYRSARAILTQANLVIAQLSDNEVIKKKTLAVSEKSGVVIVNTKYRLPDYLKQITDFKNQFILVRTNKDLNEISIILTEYNIPFSSFKRGDITLSELREELEKDTVKLLTVHTSKGLEAENVILYGNFPIEQPRYMKNNEERKVMYVGMTRAKSKLVILN